MKERKYEAGKNVPVKCAIKKELITAACQGQKIQHTIDKQPGRNYTSHERKNEEESCRREASDSRRAYVKMKDIVKELLIMTFATAIIAAAVFFFLVPSHASISSVSGLAMILSHFIPWKISWITMALNIMLLIVGFALFGREFGYKTVYTSILLPVFLALFEILFPDFTSLTGSDVLDAAGYIVVVSFGLAILFNRNASSGGIDIVAKIMSRFLRIELGTAMSLAGMAVALSSASVYSSRTVVISVLGTYLNGIVLDHFIFGQNMKKRVCIVSSNFDAVRHFIIDNLHSGATVYEAIGAYQMTRQPEIITVVNKAEYQKLMSWIEKNDPEAFITVYNVADMRYRPKRIQE